jgi:twitching motility protein PilJ
VESGKLLVSLHEMTRDMQRSMSGEREAFEGLVRNKQEFSRVIELLDKGDATLPPTGGAARDILNTLMLDANKTLADVKAVEKGRADLVTLSNAVASIDKSSKNFRVLTQQMIDAYQGEQRMSAAKLALAVEHISKDADKMLTSDVSLEQLAQLGVDVYAAEEALAALPAYDPNVQDAVKLFEPYRAGVELLVSQSRNLVETNAAARSILANTGKLLNKARLLVDAYQTTLTVRVTGVVAPVAAGVTLLLLLLLSKQYIAESHRRAAEAERANKQNQNAILRLMNELSDLAEGDLTVRATVTEDITGAIADSVNYTVEELRKLVARITAAAEQMGRATKDAAGISKGLLEAAQKQAQEIHQAEDSVQLMTRSIQEVDASAAQSAQVARRTLTVTEHGAQAVRNTIAGMDGIREQIQETSKRIKRLGESSQEIGEIVDLISDITEQTNVLALNAAIQAASAGEAGRGFSVVAEEVQRLAERSAEATKQIGALVKTIQSDTHDAVAAMEKSTLGVVEGAKLSDRAGQSLQEIEQVSNELANLISSISVSTQVQTDMAGEVVHAMQDILRITQQTTEGTRLTNNSVAQLNALATDLKGSVAGFKL